MPSAAWSHKTDGTAERRASEAMLKKQAKGSKRITVGEDKAYDTSDHIAALRRMNVTPHVAQNDSLTKTGKQRRSAIDARTTRHIGYQISQTCRKMAECIFGWGKQHGTMRKTKHRGIAAVAARPGRSLPGARIDPNVSTPTGATPSQMVFLKLILCRLKNRQTALRLPAIRRLRIAATTSSSVKSDISAPRMLKSKSCQIHNSSSANAATL